MVAVPPRRPRERPHLARRVHDGGVKGADRGRGVPCGQARRQAQAWAGGKQVEDLAPGLSARSGGAASRRVGPGARFRWETRRAERHGPLRQRHEPRATHRAGARTSRGRPHRRTPRRTRRRRAPARTLTGSESPAHGPRTRRRRRPCPPEPQRQRVARRGSRGSVRAEAQPRPRQASPTPAAGRPDPPGCARPRLEDPGAMAAAASSREGGRSDHIRVFLRVRPTTRVSCTDSQCPIIQHRQLTHGTSIAAGRWQP